MGVDKRVLGYYIFRNYSPLLTQEEWEAVQRFQSRLNGLGDSVRKLQDGGPPDPKIDALMNDRESFFETMGARVMKDHPDDVYLNLCSKCGALTRTPVAKQCVDCGHDWH